NHRPSASQMIPRMIEARSAGAHYLLYTRFAKADDRI
ncbi:hypothetical protein PSYMO_37536, partial [Pseudomonas amygdali pv. mori str. 301020]